MKPELDNSPTEAIALECNAMSNNLEKFKFNLLEVADT